MENGKSPLQELRNSLAKQVQGQARRSFESGVAQIEVIGQVAEEQYQKELREIQSYPTTLRKKMEESAQVRYETHMNYMRSLIRSLAKSIKGVVDRH
ncbi:MAG: hypothetical protein R3B53_00360 [Candidatus Paceibacterota bacterium]